MNGHRKYALHPGVVYSKTDGQKHFITSSRLAALYGIRLGQCVVWLDDQARARGRRWKDYIHLYPDYDGNYKLPKE